jgi:leucine-rich melanocyte differentiation-associated protein
VFIDKVKVLFPSLTYLSLLGNRACPNELIDETKDEYDYAKYRKYVIHRLPNLKFLDCYEITQQEREQIAKTNSLFYDTISYKDEQNSLFVENQVKPNYTPLKDDLDSNSIKKQPEFGYCRYNYYGKQSEGNRFIRNDDL